MPVEQVIERGAQRIDIAATVDELGILHLLVRHVPRRAKALMHRGQFAILVELLDEPEVAELGDAGSCEQDIAGLDIAVNETAMMEVLEGHRHIERDAGGIADGQGAGAVQQELATRAIDIFEDEKRTAGRRLALAGEGPDDMRETERLPDLCFAEETGRKAAIVAEMVGEHFERNGPALVRIVSEIDSAHAAAA